MKKRNTIFKTRRFIALSMLVIGTVLIGRCCFSAPGLTPEDRKKDIDYLAQWARDYSPLVAFNEKLKGLPSYEALKPQYVEWTEQAKDNTEYLQVVYSYASLIGASGHFYIFNNKKKRLFFTPKSAYWHELFYNHCIAHPPFLLSKRGNEYITQTDFAIDHTPIPKGSKILKVNGMTCQAYLEYLKHKTWIRFMSDSSAGLDLKLLRVLDRELLLINEGKDFKGWNIDFLLPDQGLFRHFVPAEKGRTPLKTEFDDVAQGNCVCLALTEDVGYIRIKSFSLEHAEPDKKTIHAFLEPSTHRFSKLIIDVRDNSGGRTEYFYDNLMKPFLDQPLSYQQVTGLKRKFISDNSQATIDGQRFTVSHWANETNIVEVPSPPEFDRQDWVFYKISRELQPQDRTAFQGDIFILINGQTASAADDFANAVKRTGMATLVGQNTYGSAAAYVAPVAVRLPRSGMMFILEVDLVINPDGSINEMVGTPPDITLPSAEPLETVTRQALLHDDWIQAIINK